MRTDHGILAVVLVAAAAVVAAMACTEKNVGTACEITQGKPYCKTNVAERNVASDCDDYWCLSYQGSRPFCSMECNPDEGCPEGFRCIGWVSLDPTLKGTRFCIPKSKEGCATDDDCNPDCADNPDCARDYYCGDDKYCAPTSCRNSSTTDGGTGGESDGGTTGGDS